MITKEELLVAFEESTRTLELNNQIFGLALKGLESESTVKRLIQARDQWRKKHDDLADELDDKIIALEDKLKAKDADLAVASKTINDALTVQILQAQLTESMASHHASVDDANRQIISLRNERNAFQRLVGELEIEKSCIRADLENVCKERDALKDKIEELETELGSKDDDWRLSVSYYMNLAAAWEKQAKALKAKLKKFEDFFTSED
jgi:chromosome segregation ATPase